MTPSAKLFVFSNAKAGREKEYAEWYDNRHIPDALTMKGVSGATRFKLSNVELLPGSRFDSHPYISLYDVEGSGDEDFRALGQELLARFSSELADNDVIDLEGVQIAFGVATVPDVTDDEKAAVAMGFLSRFTSWDETLRAIEECCTDDCVWVTPTLPPAEGKVAMLKFAESFRDQSAIALMKVTFKNVAVQGDSVLTERVDYSWDAEGKLLHTLQVAGVLDIRDGKVSAFREYFDTGEGHV